MNLSELKEGLPVIVDWPQGAEPATVFWNKKMKCWGLRFPDGDEFPEISEAVLEALRETREK